MSKDNEVTPAEAPEGNAGTEERTPAELVRAAAGVSRTGNAAELPGTTGAIVATGEEPAGGAPGLTPEAAENLAAQAPEATPDGYRPNVRSVRDAAEGEELEPAKLGMVRLERAAGFKVEGISVIVDGRYHTVPLPLTGQTEPAAQGEEPETYDLRIFDVDPITARFMLETYKPDGNPAFIQRPEGNPTRAKEPGADRTR